MFSNFVRATTAVWLILALLFVIGASALLGYNPYKSFPDIGSGFGLLADMFGGPATSGGIVIVMALLIVACLMMHHIARTSYINKGRTEAWHIGVVIVAIIATVVIALTMLKIDNWAPVGALFAVLAGLTLASIGIVRIVKTLLVPTANVK